MIRETTNPKYLHHSQNFIAHRVYDRSTQGHGPADPEFISQGSRNWAKGRLDTQNFRDRLPNQKPIREPEPKSRPSGSSLWVADESHDAPLWLILDRVTGHVFARVRGSLMWIVAQMRLVAGQLGGTVNDLYYRRATQ